jgi:hypothetical protein
MLVEADADLESYVNVNELQITSQDLEFMAMPNGVFAGPTQDSLMSRQLGIH